MADGKPTKTLRDRTMWGRQRWPSRVISRWLLLIVAGLLAPAGAAADSGPEKEKRPTKAVSNPMDALWSDLEKDEATASRALLRLSTRPEEAVVFLKDRLKPLGL